jgi:hypothetical protein
MLFMDNKTDQQSEILHLVWLDSYANAQNDCYIEDKLRSVTGRLTTFHEIKSCQEYIRESCSTKQPVLVVSGQMGQEIVPSIHKLPGIRSIYVYCINKQYHEQWASKYGKVTYFESFHRFYSDLYQR